MIFSVYLIMILKSISFLSCINFSEEKMQTQENTSSRKLFFGGINMNYTEALKDCRTRGGRVFIPKTILENLSWLDFSTPRTKDTSQGLNFAFYPKSFLVDKKNFIWADGKVHKTFHKIYISYKEQRKAVPKSDGVICIMYHLRIFTGPCSSSSGTFIVCEAL